MKKLVQTIEVEGQGLEALLGEYVTVFCMNYIYWGKLTGVNTADIILEEAYIVYETGVLTDGVFKDTQSLGGEWRVRTWAIESYGLLPKKK